MALVFGGNVLTIQWRVILRNNILWDWALLKQVQCLGDCAIVLVALDLADRNLREIALARFSSMFYISTALGHVVKKPHLDLSKMIMLYP